MNKFIKADIGQDYDQSKFGRLYEFCFIFEFAKTQIIRGAFDIMLINYCF